MIRESTVSESGTDNESGGKAVTKQADLAELLKAATETLRGAAVEVVPVGVNPACFFGSTFCWLACQLGSGSLFPFGLTLRSPHKPHVRFFLLQKKMVSTLSATAAIRTRRVGRKKRGTRSLFCVSSRVGRIVTRTSRTETTVATARMLDSLAKARFTVCCPGLLGQRLVGSAATRTYRIKRANHGRAQSAVTRHFPLVNGTFHFCAVFYATLKLHLVRTIIAQIDCLHRYSESLSFCICWMERNV